MIKLAVNKMPGHIPGGGFHYLLHPIAMMSDQEAEIFKLMGYVIIEVPGEKATELLKEANAALKHQVEVAILTEQALKK